MSRTWLIHQCWEGTVRCLETSLKLICMSRVYIYRPSTPARSGCISPCNNNFTISSVIIKQVWFEVTERLLSIDWHVKKMFSRVFAHWTKRMTQQQHSRSSPYHLIINQFSIPSRPQLVCDQNWKHILWCRCFQICWIESHMFEHSMESCLP